MTYDEDDELAAEAAAEMELERYHAQCEAPSAGARFALRLRDAIEDLQKVIKGATGDGEFRIVLDAPALFKIHARIVDEIKPLREIDPNPLHFGLVTVTWEG